KSEADYLKRQQARERRLAAQGSSRSDAPSADFGAETAAEARAPSSDTELDGLLKQTRQPGFISSAYFLRFRFEEGKYALVGRETVGGHDTLRIEYYPTKLFGGTDRRRTGKEPSAVDKARDVEFQRLMNKVALVTLWVDPK